MPLYHYTGFDEHGTRKEGTLDALNEDVARESLADMKITVESIQESIDIPAEESITENVVDDTPPITEAAEIPEQATQYSEAFGMNQSAPIQWEDVDTTTMHETIEPYVPLPADSPHTEKESKYYPLSDTMRLYAGWQLALYSMVYALGYYQVTRMPTFQIPYVDTLILSPILLSFTFGCFLFLLMTSVHRLVGRSGFSAFLSLVVGIALFYVYRSNV